MTHHAAPPDDRPADDETGHGSEPRHWLPGLRIVSLTTLASRVLGLVRDIAMASLFGNGVVMDAFSIAFRIPNFARRMFGEGAVTAAFLPAFVHEREESGEAAAYQLATAVLKALLVGLSGLVIAGEILLLWSMSCFEWSPGSTLLLGLTAVLLPYLMLICLTAQVSAVLHSSGRFFIPALAPIVLNLVWITAAWFLAPLFPDAIRQVYAVSIALVIAGVLQLALVAVALRASGFRLMKPESSCRSKVRGIAWAMAPVVLGLSVTQVNTLSDSLLAWAFSAPEQAADAPPPAESQGRFQLPSGTASALYFGQRMYQFPLGVFGVALGTVLFPTLTQHAQRQNSELFQQSLITGLQLVAFIGIPASAGLALMAHPLAVLLFQRGAFDAADAEQTAGMIAAYGVGVWAYCALLIVLRAYYAIGDRITPVRVGMLAVAVNLGLNFGLMFWIGAVGLALSTAVTAMCEAGLNGWLLQTRIGRVDWRPLARTVLKCAIATPAMAGACIGATLLVDVSGLPAMRLQRVVIPLAAAIATYLGLAAWLRMDELQILAGSRSRQISRRP